METRPSHCGVRHLALTTHNLEEMTTFYTEFLGFSVEWASGSRQCISDVGGRQSGVSPFCRGTGQKAIPF